MSLYQSIVLPVLARFDPERVHDWTIRLLERAQRLRFGRSLIRRVGGDTTGSEICFGGLDFPNRLGVAAGFDKDARVILGLGLLGFGQVEVGTITPKPQTGNPKPRIFRLRADKAIINRMGFPSQGSNLVAERLIKCKDRSSRPIIGVSLGKQKETPIEEAVDDYIYAMRQVHRSADYLAINISSPNTPGLRDLQQGEFLSNLLAALVTEKTRLRKEHMHRPLPLFVKIAPDLSLSELDSILDVLMSSSIEGVIATNTTVQRELLMDSNAQETGGLSGKPLAQRSNEIIKHIHKNTAGNLPIIGAGGVFNADDVRQKLDAGASLVQIYTGMIYEGPAIAGQILRELRG